MAVQPQVTQRFSEEILPYEEVKKLIVKVQNGNERAKEVLIQCNLRLVWNMVQRFKNCGYELEDLFQIGCIGLLKAVQRFDISRELQFSTYAVPMIIGEIKQFLRDDHPIKVSRQEKEVALKIRRQKEHFMKEKNREPTIRELADSLDLSKEAIVTALEATQEVASIQQVIFEGDGEGITLGDQLCDMKQEEMPLVDKLTLQQGLEKLSDLEKKVILLRYFKDKTQTEIGKILDLSQVQVSRIEKKALNMFREFMRE